MTLSVLRSCSFEGTSGRVELVRTAGGFLLGVIAGGGLGTSNLQMSNRHVPYLSKNWHLLFVCLSDNNYDLGDHTLTIIFDGQTLHPWLK